MHKEHKTVQTAVEPPESEDHGRFSWFKLELKKICRTSFFLCVSLLVFAFFLIPLQIFHFASLSIKFGSFFSNDKQERAKWDRENERSCWKKIKRKKEEKNKNSQAWRRKLKWTKGQKLTSIASVTFKERKWREVLNYFYLKKIKKDNFEALCAEDMLQTHSWNLRICLVTVFIFYF